MKLYTKYSESYAERHILQSLKISARMIGIYFLPLNDNGFYDAFKKMIRQFNQYLPTLNNLDLADFLYWYKKFANDNVANELLDQIDYEVLRTVIIKYIQDNEFLPRQLNMIYECLDMIFPEDEELLSQFIGNLFNTNDITATQLLQFLSSISKKYALEKKLDLQAILQFLDYSSKIKSFDVDQIASVVKSVATMKLHLYVTERKYLEFIEYAFQVTQQNIDYLESGQLLNLLTAKKYLPKNYGSQFFIQIHQKLMQILINQSETNLDFLIQYITRTLNFDYVSESDREFLLDLCVRNFEKTFTDNDSINFTLLLIRMKKVQTNYVEFLKRRLVKLDIYKYNIYHMYLVYMHWICREDLTVYLDKVDFQCQLAVSEEESVKKVSRVCAANLSGLFDEYNRKLPPFLYNILQKQSFVTTVQTYSACIFKSEKMRTFYMEKITSLRENSVKFEHYKFWSQFLSMIHSQEEAVAFADWLSIHRPEFLNQVLPSIFTTQDSDDITNEQATFLRVFLLKNVKNLNMEIVMNGIIYTESLFQMMVEQNSEILDTLFTYSHRCKDGLGTAQLIMLLEEKFPDRLNEFPIEDHLIYSYEQLQRYDANFILMMIRYGCIPLQDSLTIYRNLINYSSNELRLLILYLAMSKQLTMEKLAIHIKEQLKNLNETYLIITS